MAVEMDLKHIKKRILSVRSRLERVSANCLIITKPANVTYTTGFTGSSGWAVITPRTVYLLTDSRYTEQARKQCSNCVVVDVPDSMAATAGRLIDKLKSTQTAAVENSASLAVFNALKKNVKCRLKAVSDIVEPSRSIKDADEISKIRRASSIAAAALKKSECYIKPGVTENELAGIIDLQIRKLSAVISFDTIVAFGAGTSQPHHQPGKRKLKSDDTILIDFGARYKNYCCDITRCFVVGRATALYKKVYNVVRASQTAALKMIKPGAGICEVDLAARKIIAEYDLPVYGHSTGHGLGLEVHEQPTISANSKEKFQIGQVVTIEPGVYIAGKLGVRIEDDILVTADGCEILTSKCPKIKIV